MGGDPINGPLNGYVFPMGSPPSPQPHETASPIPWDVATVRGIGIHHGTRRQAEGIHATCVRHVAGYEKVGWVWDVHTWIIH